MAWVAVDKDGEEWIFNKEPLKSNDYWEPISANVVFLPKGSIKKLIGRELTWTDNPVELK